MDRIATDAEDTPRYWHYRVWRLAGPVIAANISVPLLGAVDTAVVGRLPGPEYVGAVAVAALIFSLAYHGCNFLRMGTTGLTAQSFGAGDGSAVRAWLARAVILGGSIGLLFVLLQWPIYELARLVVAPSAAVDHLARAYFEIRIWGAPAALANFALLGWFFGVQNAKAALVVQLFMNGVNLVLAIWFVWGLDLGVPGVAWATLIAEVSSIFLGLWLAQGTLRRMGGQFARNTLFDRTPFLRMLSINGDIFVRSMCLQAALITLTAVGSRMGDTVLAANALMLHFQTMMSGALDAFANAAEALVGAAIGAGSRRQFDHAVRISTIWAVGFAIVIATLYAVFGGAIIDILTTVEEVRAVAHMHLVWVAILPLVSVWSFQLDGVFIGCTWSRQMRNSMALALFGYLVILSIAYPLFGNHGIWAAFTAFMLLRGARMMWYFQRLKRSVGTAAG
ncbi:MAG: MATE family efflux transporter [Proteobacteria bacterium]|nr:MATE family efflux transporter [Pseudomonadota bacterium]